MIFYLVIFNVMETDLALLLKCFESACSGYEHLRIQAAKLQGMKNKHVRGWQLDYSMRGLVSSLLFLKYQGNMKFFVNWLELL